MSSHVANSTGIHARLAHDISGTPLRRYLTVITITIALLTGGATMAGANDVPPDPLDQSESRTSIGAVTKPGATEPQCMGAKFVTRSDDKAEAEHLMTGKLTLPTFGEAALPKNPTWRENPFGNGNWAYQFHTLRWADPLRRVGVATGDQAMLDRYEEIVKDWVADNPIKTPRSTYAWYDMSVGVRSITLVCAASVLEPATWLTQSMVDHAKMLTDVKEYRVTGNHALHQNMGLLALGCSTGNSVWRGLAVKRNTTLFDRSVDSQGVTDEGSVTYQYLNYLWYSEFKERMDSCDLTAPASFARLALMPTFMAHAMMPNGNVVAFGDTDSVSKGTSIPGTAAEYAATLGKLGNKPTGLFKTYKRGFAFSRSAWFDTQDWNKQSQAALRYGPARTETVHGHEDAGNLSYFALGKQVLWQPGQYGGGGGKPRMYVHSNAAHNTINIPSLKYNRSATSQLSVTRTSSLFDLVTIKNNVFSGVNQKRTMIHFKKANFLVVDDQIRQNTSRAVVQHWNLGRDRKVTVKSGRAATSGSGANANFLWAGTTPRLKSVKGQTSPLLGWRSEKANTFQSSPLVEASITGKNVRFTTIIVPRGTSTVSSKIKVLRTNTNSTRRLIDISVGTTSYRITFATNFATVRELP